MFDEVYKIVCHKNGFFTVLLKNKTTSKAVVVTFSVVTLTEPESRIFDFYEIDRYPDQLVTYETEA